MPQKSLALTLATATIAFASHAHAQAMPGMAMPPASQQSAPPNAPKPNHTRNPADPHAPDIRSMQHDAGDARAKAAARSEADSVRQQDTQIGMKPGEAAAASSLNVPIQTMQEPEAEDFHTGSDLPAPELLGDVVAQSPMTLQQFIDLAERNNPTLVQAQRDIDRSNQQARQAGLPPDPVLGYSGDHIRGGSYRGGEEGAFFSQEFVLGRKLALRREAYRAEGRANVYALAVQRARIHDDVAHLFFDTLAAQATTVVRDRLLKSALDAETNSHELQRVGQADASDVLNAEIAAEQAKIDFTHAQRMFLASFARLATAAGQHTLPPHPLTGGLTAPPALNAQEVVATDIQDSPEVKQAEARAAMAEVQLKDARRERVPNLNVTAGEWYSGEPLDNGAKVGWMSFAQAGVQLPLWNHNQGNIGAAAAIVDRARHEVDRTRLLTESRATPLAQDYLTARDTAERYRTEMLPRARRAYQLEAMKYQQMAQSYPPVLRAQQMLFTLQLSYIRALDAQWAAAIALTNYALSGGLDHPSTTGDDNTLRNTPTGAGM